MLARIMMRVAIGGLAMSAAARAADAPISVTKGTHARHALASDVHGQRRRDEHRRRIRWLRLQPRDDLRSQFKPQPWEQLIRVLRASGDERTAAHLLGP